jgi:hypothetical protein
LCIYRLGIVPDFKLQWHSTTPGPTAYIKWSE